MVLLSFGLTDLLGIGPSLARFWTLTDVSMNRGRPGVRRNSAARPHLMESDLSPSISSAEAWIPGNHPARHRVQVGIQVGSLYNHITSKGDLLFDIMETVMLDLLEDQRQVVKKPDVVERMNLSSTTASSSTVSALRRSSSAIARCAA